MSIASLLTQTMDVYGPDPSAGDFSALAASGISCRLSLPGTGGGAVSVADRAELLKTRTLYYDTTYAMPSEAQVLIDGERWNVQRGTEQAPTDPRTQLPAYCAVDVVRAQT